MSQQEGHSTRPTRWFQTQSTFGKTSMVRTTRSQDFPRFSHSPLDQSTTSIRLLKILPDLSTDGYIQCAIWPETTSANYVCLSYVWGPEPASYEILVNGGLLLIRTNLHGFLAKARKKNIGLTVPLWIDALCIDQSSVLERNHQVAQMGMIYSSAQRVIGWLGNDEDTEYLLRYCAQMDSESPQTSEEAWSLRDPRRIQHFGIMWRNFSRNKYWTRAWITQEVLLAREYDILVKETEVKFSTLSAIKMILPRLRTAQDESEKLVFYTYLDDMLRVKRLVGEDLLQLLIKLPDRECQIPRDRVYSLLAVASANRDIPVNYASSTQELFARLVDFCRPAMCFCTWLFLADQFDLDYNDLQHIDYWKDEPKFRIKQPDAVQTSDKRWCPGCGTWLEKEKSWEQLICPRAVCKHAGSSHVYITAGKTYVRDDRSVRQKFAPADVRLHSTTVQRYGDNGHPEILTHTWDVSLKALYAMMRPGAVFDRDKSAGERKESLCTWALDNKGRLQVLHSEM